MSLRADDISKNSNLPMSLQDTKSVTSRSEDVETGLERSRSLRISRQASISEAKSLVSEEGEISMDIILEKNRLLKIKLREKGM